VVGFASTNNTATQNSIFQNAGLGIDLAPTGMTPNDSSDADSGSNNLQNFPEDSSSTLSGGLLNVRYQVPSSTTNSTYPLRVEFFKADSDGEEGRFYIGFDTFTAANFNAGSKTIKIARPAFLAPGDKLVGTATDAAGNTSEFS